MIKINTAKYLNDFNSLVLKANTTNNSENNDMIKK